MQRNFCDARIESAAVVPWLNGRIRRARTWVRAPLLINGVPLHSGQWVERRLKNAISQVMALKIMAPMRIRDADWLGCMNKHTKAVRLAITQR